MIHPPQTETELDSVLSESARRGFPGCIGFMDGVHVHWDKCPSQWKHLCTGKNPYPTIGWQCSVNQHRRFMSVSEAQFGGVNDQSAIKYDRFTQQLRTDPLYKNISYNVYDKNGLIHTEKGVWLNVDGGYLKIPELIVGDPESLSLFMNYWTTFMESERKHVECAFGILKARFRILKLPIRMQNFQTIDDVFVTCCILHNMCLEVDGGDDGWNLGSSTGYGDFIEGPDGQFSDDDNHSFYWSESMYYDLNSTTDYTLMGSLQSTLGSKQDTTDFTKKRNKLAQHWYYMYRQRMIRWD